MRFSLFIGAIALTASLATKADAVPVPSFTGSYDEATGPEAAGDYDNIGGALDVGDFSLVAGANTFAGSVFTPDDPADVFNIVLGANQSLVGASIIFAENATAFNPYFAFPPPNWGLFESSVTPTIFNIPMGPDPAQAFAPLNFTAPSFTRGPGIYNMLIGNGTFGMNNGGGVDYTMTFNVEETVIPVPAALPLAASGLGVLGMLGWRRRRKQTSA